MAIQSSISIWSQCLSNITVAGGVARKRCRVFIVEHNFATTRALLCHESLFVSDYVCHIDYSSTDISLLQQFWVNISCTCQFKFFPGIEFLDLHMGNCSRPTYNKDCWRLQTISQKIWEGSNERCNWLDDTWFESERGFFIAILGPNMEHLFALRSIL